MSYSNLAAHLALFGAAYQRKLLHKTALILGGRLSHEASNLCQFPTLHFVNTAVAVVD